MYNEHNFQKHIKRAAKNYNEKGKCFTCGYCEGDGMNVLIGGDPRLIAASIAVYVDKLSVATGKDCQKVMRQVRTVLKRMERKGTLASKTYRRSNEKEQVQAGSVELDEQSPEDVCNDKLYCSDGADDSDNV